MLVPTSWKSGRAFPGQPEARSAWHSPSTARPDTWWAGLARPERWTRLGLESRPVGQHGTARQIVPCSGRHGTVSTRGHGRHGRHGGHASHCRFRRRRPARPCWRRRAPGSRRTRGRHPETPPPTPPSPSAAASPAAGRTRQSPPSPVGRLLPDPRPSCRSTSRRASALGRGRAEQARGRRPKAAPPRLLHLAAPPVAPKKLQEGTSQTLMGCITKYFKVFLDVWEDQHRRCDKSFLQFLKTLFAGFSPLKPLFLFQKLSKRSSNLGKAFNKSSIIAS